jgi:hypothetical protein
MKAKHELERLKDANLPRVQWRAIFPKAQPSDEEAATLDGYFQRFTLPTGACPCCSRPGPTIRWGIAHGEAFCVDCGWPYRVYHYDLPAIGGKCFDAAMPYHPSELTVHRKEAA